MPVSSQQASFHRLLLACSRSLLVGGFHRLLLSYSRSLLTRKSSSVGMPVCFRPPLYLPAVLAVLALLALLTYCSAKELVCRHASVLPPPLYCLLYWQCWLYLLALLTYCSAPPSAPPCPPPCEVRQGGGVSRSECGGGALQHLYTPPKKTAS